VAVVAAIKAILRLFSYVFHIVLTLFLIAVSALALASGSPTLQLRMLPWSGTTLIYVLFFACLFGLATVILAIIGRVRFLFFLWSVAVAVFLLKGYVFSGYRFIPGEASRALYLIVASWIAVAGAWFQIWNAPPRKRY
jgi:hypothetical protein